MVKVVGYKRGKKRRQIKKKYYYIQDGARYPISEREYKKMVRSKYSYVLSVDTYYAGVSE